MQQMTIVKALLVLVPCAILNSIGMDIFAPALPEMMKVLNTTEHQIQYIAIMFTLSVGIGQPFIGLLCDKFGRRRVMLLSALLFFVTSFGTTLCTNIQVLSLLRFLQGFGACGTMVVTFAVVNDLFDEKTSFRLFSYIGCALALTPMLAPILGVGLMHKYGGWEVCFVFLGLFSLLATVICYFALPETKPSNTIIPNVNNLVNNYKKVISNKRFVVYTLFGTVAMTELYLYFSIGNMLYINVLGATPFMFSMIFAFNAIVYLIGNYYSTHMQKKMSAFDIATMGSTFIVVGSLLMVFIYLFFKLSILGVMIPNTIMTIGVGLMIGPATGAALQPFKELAGTASGLFGTLQYGTPALIGYLVTRASIQSSMSIAVPMLFFSIIALVVAMNYRDCSIASLSTSLK